MSESYTTGGDTWYDLGGYNNLSQSFKPQETFDLLFIDVEAQFTTPWNFPRAHVKHAFPNGSPYGDALSASKLQRYMPAPSGLFRTRLEMEPQVTLEEGESYAIELHSPYGPYPASARVRFDAGDATYPRGNKCHSSDGGNTWTPDYNDDVIFAIFGTPPAPPSPPPPPVRNWAIVDIEQTITAEGYKIVVATNVPVHLHMFWTDEEPGKHSIAVMRRGDLSLRRTRMCFVKWHENEQEEAGDTLYHTFIKEPWAVCETRWFTFKGKIENTFAPSVGPIFKKHRVAVPLTMTFYPDPSPEVVSVDGYLRKYSHNFWYIQQSGNAEQGYHHGSSGLVGISRSYRTNRWQTLARDYYLFDTSPLGASVTIVSAYFQTYSSDKIQTGGMVVAYNIFASNPLSNNDLVFADWTRVSSVPFSTKIPHASIGDPGPNIWHLNAAGLAAINKTGITKFSLREANYDAPNIEPTWTSTARGYSLFYMVEVANADWRPRLVVTYKP